MDSNGRLTITKDGKETFKGDTFEDTGVAEEYPNRKERRRVAAEDRRRARRLSDHLAKLEGRG